MASGSSFDACRLLAEDGSVEAGARGRAYLLADDRNAAVRERIEAVEEVAELRREEGRELQRDAEVADVDARRDRGAERRQDVLDRLQRVGDRDALRGNELVD